MERSRCDRCGGTRRVEVPASTATFLGRAFAIREHEEPCPGCSSVEVRAIRENCSTGQTSIQPVTMICEVREGQLTIKIDKGGVTGYESCYYTPSFKDWVREKGWPACAGTKGRYDRLFIPAKEMRTVLEKLQLT